MFRNIVCNVSPVRLFFINLLSVKLFPLLLYMNDIDKQIDKLKEEVETMLGKKVNGPKDFSNLSEQIFNRLKIVISPTTLKRLWGYLNEGGSPRKSTLTILAQFIGYRDWNNFCNSPKDNNAVQSNLILSRKISALALSKGDKLKITWRPDRYCIISYNGNLNFTVLESRNAKIQTGDTFDCSIFIEGEPMYADNLIHENYKGISYIAGKKDGIRFELLKDPEQ